MPRKLTIRHLILLVIVLPVLGVVAATAYLGLQALERYLERRLQEDVELVGRAVQLPLQDALIQGDVDDMQRILDSAFRIGRVYGATVYDQDGERIAAAGAGVGDAPSEDMARLAERGNRQREYTEVGRRRVYSFFMPLVTSAGEVVGLLQVTRRRREMEESLRRARLQAGLAILGCTVLVVGVVVGGHRRVVGGPLDRLARSMSRIEGGERGHRAETAVSTREVATLAHGLNSMVESLVRSEDEVERKRREQFALQARLQISERMAAIGELAAGVAHELGTPLSVVDGLAQRALRESRLSETSRRRWEGVRRECQRIEEIVQDLLAMDRGEPPTREPVAPERLVRRALSAASPEIRESGGRVDVLRWEGGGEGRPRPVRVDRRRVEQAVANLLRNAAQASPGGRVELGWRVSGERLVFVVDDDGPGIPPSERARVLRPFYTTRDASGGTGLGLTLAQGVAEEHDGTIEIGESPLGGARVVLTLRHEEAGTSGTGGAE